MKKFYCVTEDCFADADSRFTAHEYDTEAEAEAFSDGVDYCQDTELKTRGVYAAENEDEAISMAKDEAGEIDGDDEADVDEDDRPGRDNPHAPDCAKHATGAAECTCGKADREIEEDEANCDDGK